VKNLLTFVPITSKNSASLFIQWTPLWKSEGFFVCILGCNACNIAVIYVSRVCVYEYFVQVLTNEKRGELKVVLFG
jgi:hypothetical protein